MSEYDEINAILVFDREESIAEPLKQALPNASHLIRFVSNEQEGLKILEEQSNKLHLVISDNLNFLRKIKKISASLLILTGFEEKQNVMHALNDGIDDYLKKPLSPSEISHTLRKALHRYLLEHKNHKLTSELEEVKTIIKKNVESEKRQHTVLSSTSSLGAKLKALREMKGFSFRELKTKTGISVAHLFLLENNKVRNPSPNMLKNIANAYGISFHSLMKAAGYLEETHDPDPNHDKPKKMDSEFMDILKSIEDFSTDEIKELQNYIKFLRQKKKDSSP